MLKKLIYRNLHSSFRDYILYFISLLLSSAMFYMFNSLEEQKLVLELPNYSSKALDNFTKIMPIASVFVAVVLAFLILYANYFFMKNRKKELAIYMLLGMKKSKISLIILAETLFSSLLALFFGLFFGVFLSQFASVYTAKIFETEINSFKFIFSKEAAISTVIYFLIINSITVIFNGIIVGQYKLIDLLKSAEKNQKHVIKNPYINIAIFIISTLVLAFAYDTIIKNGLMDVNEKFLQATILGIIGTFLFFLSLSSSLSNIAMLSKKFYYRKLNAIIIRKLMSKIRTNLISFTIVCLCLFIVLSLFSFSSAIQKETTKMASQLKADISVLVASFDYNTNFDLGKKIDVNTKEDDFIKISLYTNKDKNLIDLNDRKTAFVDIKLTDDNLKKKLRSSANGFVLSLNDYNKLQKKYFENSKSLELDNNSYAFISSGSAYLSDLKESIKKNNIKINLNDKKLKPIVIETQSFVSANVLYAIVVSDENIKKAKKVGELININSNDEKKLESFKNKIQNSINHKEVANDKNSVVRGGYAFKEEFMQAAYTTRLIIGFLFYYLGAVFIVVSAAILGIQNVSEAFDSKKNYSILHKLGASRMEINKGVFYHTSFYFAIPLFLAILHTVVAFKAFGVGLNLNADVYSIDGFLKTAIFVIAIYGTYLLASYHSAKRIVSRK